MTPLRSKRPACRTLLLGCLMYGAEVVGFDVGSDRSSRGASDQRLSAGLPGAGVAISISAKPSLSPFCSWPSANHNTMCSLTALGRAGNLCAVERQGGGS